MVRGRKGGSSVIWVASEYRAAVRVDDISMISAASMTQLTSLRRQAAKKGLVMDVSGKKRARSIIHLKSGRMVVSTETAKTLVRRLDFAMGYV